MHVLVVGGTRILRPAADALEARGHRVTALARGARDEADAARLQAVDLAGPAVEVERALADAAERRGAPDAALVYAPSATAAALAALSGAVAPDGVVVHLLPSEHAGPDADPDVRARRSPPAGRRTAVLDLGWTHDEDGASRWHTPQEVSDAALALLDDGGRDHAVLGRLAPWAERPD